MIGAVLLCGLPWAARAQHPGAPDGTFRTGAGPSDDVFSAAALPGGETLLGGYFTSFDGVERWRLARLRVDGTLDPGFDPGDSSGSAPVKQVAALPDGRAYAAGAFTRFGGAAHPLVVRLKADGSVDGSFNTAPTFAGIVGRVNALATLPDGTLLAGGRFDVSAGSTREASALLVRLRANGARDEGFACEAVPTGREDQVVALAALPDGKILIGTGAGLERLTSGGARDRTFQPAASAKGSVLALAVQTDGTLVVAVARAGGGWRIGRLKADGTADAAFQPVETAGDAAGTVDVLAPQADGKLLVGGTFREITGARRHGLARLNGDGTLDAGFDVGTGAETLPLDEADETPEAAVHAILPLPEGKVLVAGKFDLYNGQVFHNVMRLFDGGAVPGPMATAAGEK